MIKINLDRIMLDRKISSKELAQQVGITQANLSILKTQKAKGVRFNTLDSICKILQSSQGILSSM